MPRNTVSPPARSIASSLGGSRPAEDRVRLKAALHAQKAIDALSAYRLSDASADPADIDDILDLSARLQDIVRERARASLSAEAFERLEARLADNFSAAVRDAS